MEFQLVNVFLLVFNDRILNDQLVFEAADSFLHLGLFLSENAIFIICLGFGLVLLGFGEGFLLEVVAVAFVPGRVVVIDGYVSLVDFRLGIAIFPG